METLSGKLIDPELWQQSGGLLGLTLFAFFMCVVLLVYALFRGFFTIQQWHRDDMNSIRSAHTEERARWEERMEELQDQTVDKFTKLLARYEARLKPPKGN